MLKCNVAMLRLTPLLSLLALPLALSHLFAFHNRERPPSISSPRLDAVVLSAFPIAWFFGFLYYTEIPGLVAVAITFAAATQGQHLLASLVRLARFGRNIRLMERKRS
jgi:alpha-1,2-glucosyltransferase